MEKNSNFFDRLMYLANCQGYKNASELATALHYTSPEKLYRLQRDEKATPSFQILLDIANLFEKADLRWLVTGKRDNTPYPIPESRLDIVNDIERTPMAKSGFVPSSRGDFVPPAVPPTDKNCLLCDEKERLIASMLGTIEAQRDSIQALKNLLDVTTQDREEKRKQVG